MTTIDIHGTKILLDLSQMTEASRERFLQSIKTVKS
jgi:hypothetical protein